MLGAALYAAGDILLLAPTGPSHPPFPVDLSGDRLLRRRVKLFELMATLPHWHLRWGALLGVIGGPFTLAGTWLFYRGIESAGPAVALPPTLLFVVASVIGPFVHGSFAHFAETVQAIYGVSEA